MLPWIKPVYIGFLFSTFPLLSKASCCGGREDCDVVPSNANMNSSLENVALGKSVKLHRTQDAGSYSNALCLAVNGRKNSDRCCVESSHGDLNPALTVDLGQVYNISFVTVYRRERQTIRLYDMKIFVDEQLCDVISESVAEGDNTSLPSNVPLLPVPIRIHCQPDRLSGRFVTLVRNSTSSGRIHGRNTVHFHYLINICEIEVWVERNGLPTTSTPLTTTSTPLSTTHTSPTTTSTTRRGETPRTITPGKISGAGTTLNYPHVLVGVLGTGTAIACILLLCLAVCVVLWAVRRRGQNFYNGPLLRGLVKSFSRSLKYERFHDEDL